MQVCTKNWDTKGCYLLTNPVTAAPQIDLVFKNVWGKVTLSGMHSIGQILNYGIRRECQGWGT